MLNKRLGVLSFCAAGLMLMLGVVQAGATAPTKVLKFYDPPAVATGVGFDLNSNTPPPVGGSEVIQTLLKNVGSQFGKPSGTTVGHVLLDCTVLSVNAAAGSVDGICTGIAHVPNGYFTFDGNGIFAQNGKANHYAITGGVGAYADDRGEIKVVNNSNGGSVATANLYSP